MTTSKSYAPMPIICTIHFICKKSSLRHNMTVSVLVWNCLTMSDELWTCICLAINYNHTSTLMEYCVAVSTMSVVIIMTNKVLNCDSLGEPSARVASYIRHNAVWHLWYMSDHCLYYSTASLTTNTLLTCQDF